MQPLYPFQPLAFENVGTLNASAISPVAELLHKISDESNDELESIFLFQRLSVTVKRSNLVLFASEFRGRQ